MGILSSDDGDGSENATVKMNSLFSFKRRRDYSNSLEMSNVGEISWS